MIADQSRRRRFDAVRGFVLSELDKWKAVFDRTYPQILAFLKEYFWVYYCTVFTILGAFSYFFSIETNTTVPVTICVLAVVLIAVSLGVLLHQCPKFSDRFLYFGLVALATFQLIFHLPASLPALGIALFLGMLLLLPRLPALLPFVSAAGCLCSEYFAYCFVTITLLCVYVTRSSKTERQNKACLYSLCLSAVIVAVMQIVLYGGFQSCNSDFSAANLRYIAAVIVALSSVICFYDEIQKRKACIAMNASMLLWCLLWPDLLAPAIVACVVFYHHFFDGFLQKAWRFFLEKTGPCLLCFSIFVCILHVGRFNLPKTYYAIYVYYLNYLDMGFIRRSLIGTILYLLLGYNIPWFTMRCCIAVLCYIEAALSIYLIARMIRRLQTDNALILAAFSTVLIVVIPSMLSPDLIGHMENHLSLILLLCLTCVFKGGKAVWFTVPLCAAGICIHTAFIFYCFSLVFLMVFYSSILQSEKPKKTMLLLLGLLAAVTCGLFVYMTYYSYAFSRLPSENGLQYMIERSGEIPTTSNDRNALKITFYDVINANSSKHLSYAEDKLGMDIQLKSILRMRFFIPHLLLYSAAFWISAKHMSSVWIKWAVRILPFGLVTFLPLYLFETDHGRWNTMLVLWLCMGVIGITVLQKKDKWYSMFPDNVSKLIALTMVITTTNAGLFSVFI